jgi:3-oxoadipate enol-lactonase
MTLIEKTLQRPDGVIHYWIGGKKGAPLVVLTHGATIDHHEWDATIPLLESHYQVLTLDIRSHGLSRPMPFEIGKAEGDLLALLDELKISQAIFVGHSMGGNLHQDFVFHHPERVKAMVFLGCTWNFQKLTAFERSSLSLVKPMYNIYPLKLLIKQSLPGIATSKASQDLLGASMRILSKEEFVNIVVGILNYLHYEPGYTIGKPLLMMMGDKDWTGNIRKAMPVWAKVEPDCRFYIIPNARHGANLDNPAFFHEKLLAFLEEADKRQGS